METLKGVMGRLNTYIDSPQDLVGKQVRVHWHFNEKRYSVSLRASNGKWYVIRHRETGAQLFFGKLVMKDVLFQVQPAAAKKSYETGKRTVHASLIGTVLRAQFAREGVVVPCGQLVAYSHSLYPEPEFKYNLFGYDGSFFNKPISQWPGIKKAEMVAMGVRLVDQYLNKPQMLATGELELS